MKIALAQFTATIDPQHNLRQVRDGIAQAAQAGARLIVFPEAMICAFSRPRIDIAEPLAGPWAGAVRQSAAEAGIAVVVGTFTPGSGDKVRNTLLITGPGLDAHYDKLHLFDAYGYRESDQIEPGGQLVTFAWDGVTFGVATCFDIRFPAMFTELARAGAEVMVVPTSWARGPGKVQQWQVLVPARALDSTSVVLGVGQALPAQSDGSSPTGVGHSIVAGPLGEVLLELGEGPVLAFFDLDPDVVQAAREKLPVLANNRFVEQLV